MAGPVFRDNTRFSRLSMVRSLKHRAAMSCDARPSGSGKYTVKLEQRPAKFCGNLTWRLRTAFLLPLRAGLAENVGPASRFQLSWTSPHLQAGNPPMNTALDHPLSLTRRHFLRTGSLGIGSLALSLLSGGRIAADNREEANPLAPRR